MKKIITSILIVTVVLCAANSYAQRGSGRMMDPAVMKQRLIDSLQLTGVQADSVVAIQQEYRPKMREIFMDQSMSQDDKRAKLAEINEERNKRIKAILGDDLFKKYQDFEQRNRPQRGMGMRGGGNDN
jgi:hypothetical protein